LIRIGGRADDDAFAHRDPCEIGIQGANQVLLHEDAFLEGFPGVRAAVISKLGVGELAGVVRTLDDVAMGVACVAVATPELTPDVRIERPVCRSRSAGSGRGAVW
jgi:hypothetical protein